MVAPTPPAEIKPHEASAATHLERRAADVARAARRSPKRSARSPGLTRMNCCGSAARRSLLSAATWRRSPGDSQGRCGRFLALAKAELRKSLKERSSSRPMAPAIGYVPIEANAEGGERAHARRAPDIARRTLVKDYDPEEPRKPKYSPGGGEWTKDGGSGSVSDFFSRHSAGFAAPRGQFGATSTANLSPPIGRAKFRPIIRSIRCNSWTVRAGRFSMIKASQCFGQMTCRRKSMRRQGLHRIWPGIFRRGKARWTSQ